MHFAIISNGVLFYHPAFPVCSVMPTVLDGFYPYLTQMITSIMTFDIDLYLQGHSAMLSECCTSAKIRNLG